MKQKRMRIEKQYMESGLEISIDDQTFSIYFETLSIVQICFQQEKTRWLFYPNYIPHARIPIRCFASALIWMQTECPKNFARSPKDFWSSPA